MRIELAAAGHLGRLDEENVAAGRRPGKPGRHPGHGRAHRHLALEAARPEDRVQLIGADPHAVGVAFGDAHGDVVQQRADLALEIAHAGLARVIADDGADGVLVDLALLGGEARRFKLPLHQIALGDLDLFVLGVAGELDHLHAVA